MHTRTPEARAIGAANAVYSEQVTWRTWLAMPFRLAADLFGLIADLVEG